MNRTSSTSNNLWASSAGGPLGDLSLRCGRENLAQNLEITHRVVRDVSVGSPNDREFVVRVHNFANEVMGRLHIDVTLNVEERLL